MALEMDFLRLQLDSDTNENLPWFINILYWLLYFIKGIVFFSAQVCADPTLISVLYAIYMIKI